MEASKREPPEAAARAIVEARYPDALAAFVAGSVVRGEGTPTSDLDMVIIMEREEAPFRESFIARGWPVEAFIHTPRSFRRFFQKDAKERTPALAAMCFEGIVLRDVDGMAAQVRAEAQALLDAGPEALSEDERTVQRYMLTDVLDDFIGAVSHEEAVFVAAALTERSANLLLAHRGHWGGWGKGLLRALRRSCPEEAGTLVHALARFHTACDREPLIAFVESVLGEAGGRYFDGFHQQAPRDPDD